MGKSSKRLIFAIVLVFVLIIGSYSLPIREKQSNTNRGDKIYHHSEGSVDIRGNDELEGGEYTGNGTKTNPYIIANLTIDGFAEGVQDGLALYNIDVHVLIQNCSVTADVGIRIENCSNIIIENCTLFEGREGAIILDSSDILVQTCSIISCSNRGVYISGVNDSKIQSSHLLDIGERVTATIPPGHVGEYPYFDYYGEGVVLEACENVTLVDVTMTQCPYAPVGFVFFDSLKTNITNNFIDEVDIGLYFEESVDSILENNILEETTLALGGNMESVFKEVKDNQLNGKILGIFIGLNDSIIDGSLCETAILINCTNTIVNGGVFQNCEPSSGFWNSINCAIEEAVTDKTMWILDSRGCSIETTSIITNRWISSGIMIRRSDRSIVSNCIIETGLYEASFGIFVDSSNYVTINDNVVNDITDCGVRLSSSEHCFIENNSIFECGTGIDLVFVENSEIKFNWIENSENNGVVFSNTDHCYFVNNTVVGSGDYGIFVGETSAYNRFYYNIVGWSGLHNAEDWGLFNIWDDDRSRGNNWSDYIGSGQYSIYGGGGVDNYPSGIDNGYWTPPWPFGIDPFILTLIIIGSIALAFVGSGLFMKRIRSKAVRERQLQSRFKSRTSFC